MRIAQVAPVWERVPPVRYGGIELVVSLLTEELVRRGHEVTLFATGDSVTKAKLKSLYDHPVREAMGNVVPDLLHVTSAFHETGSFDVIHNHTGYSGVSMATFVDKPVLTTLHGIFTELNTKFFRAFKDAVYYNSISDEQRKPCPDLNYIGTVYNAIDVDAYKFSGKKKDFFIHISRVSPLKGQDVAVRMAKKAGVKLIMAGKIDTGRDTDYFHQKVEPGIDGKQIQFLGEITEKKKSELFREAKAFLFPLQWAEPFGLVITEAMVCGTPVIAFPKGSIPELVVDGKTGFIPKTEEEMVKAIKNIDQIDPADCRAHVEKNFSVAHMTDCYEAIYEKMVKQGKPKGKWSK